MWLVCCVLALAASGALPRGSAGGTPADVEEGPVTLTPAGAIRGSWMRSWRGRRFQAYRGLRYAEPPVGALRFQPPVLISQYETEVDGSAEGPSCPLVAPPAYYQDEDCLRLNVYTPATNSSKPLPVVFFIHAGGFFSMNGRSDLAGPHYLMDRDLVFVAINYRIGPLGFLSTGDEHAPGNNGMKDQVAALRWVQRNIASFGGNPDLVTIAGCSAGSISVMLHMISPMAKGLFHRAISMSAAPTGPEAMGAYPRHQRHLAVQQAEFLACPTNNSKAMVDCLKTQPWKELGNYLRFFPSRLSCLALWKPVLEPDLGQERYLTLDPADAIAQGRMHAVPHLISQTTDEFFWVPLGILKNETLRKRLDAEWETLLPYTLSLPDEGSTEAAARLRRDYLGGKPLAGDEPTAKALGKLYGDAFVGFPVHRMANLMSKFSPHAVYHAEFAYAGRHSHYEDPKTRKTYGVAHHDDLLYVLTLSYAFPRARPGGADALMVDKMTALWYNFARYGDPNPREDTPELGSLSWPPMKPSDRRYLRIGEEFEIKSNLFEERYKTWEELYPTTYYTIN